MNYPSAAVSDSFRRPTSSPAACSAAGRCKASWCCAADVPSLPTISRDVSNTGIGGQRPNRIGSGKLDNPTIARWFDKTAFTVPNNFTYGNSGVDILREDRFKNLDLSLFKQFQFNERVRLQFRAEAFNLTNTPSFSSPGSNIDLASGGIVTSTISAPRNVQFGLKLNF